MSTVGLNSPSESRTDVVLTGMPVLIILHSGIVCVQFGNVLHHRWIPIL